MSCGSVRLTLPCESPSVWEFTARVLSEGRERLLRDGDGGDLTAIDAAITAFAKNDQHPQTCSFFKGVTCPDVSDNGGAFDFERFRTNGAPFLFSVALEMPVLFQSSPTGQKYKLPICQMRSSWAGKNVLGKKSLTLTRRQIACLLAHSLFGSLKRPDGVQRNDYRFTAVDLFLGTAASPNSATTFLNYFSVLGEKDTTDKEWGLENVTFERLGFEKGYPPWNWEESDKPLCKARVVDGGIEESAADVHTDFANAFVGGGCMSGDAAQEEMLFLIKPELMVAMALQSRMVDTEVVRIAGAMQYSIVEGYGQDFKFRGDYDGRRKGGNNLAMPIVCAIDAVRGGGPALTQRAMLRDMNKARLGFEGAHHIASGHWGCGAYGNNNNLMFLKQWLAASEAGATRLDIHDFSKDHSHHIVPLIRKLRHLTVGQLWSFVLDITSDLVPCKMGEFYKRVCSIATGKMPVPGAGSSTPGLAQHAIKAITGEDAATKEDTTPEPSGSKPAAPLIEEPATIYPFESLTSGCPDGVDPKRKQDYLSSADFMKHLGMSRQAFAGLPKWVQNREKKRVGLF